jgi:PAS domain-containing protein
MGFYLIDEKGRVLLANEVGAPVYGQRLIDILGKVIFEFVNPELARLRREKQICYLKKANPLHLKILVMAELT